MRCCLRFQTGKKELFNLIVNFFDYYLFIGNNRSMLR